MDSVIIWQCTKCNKNLDGNPNSCPQCGYTVYRPVGRTDDLPRDTPKNDPIADRRQRAREAYNDAIVEMYNDLELGTNSRFELAIEVATQVKITDDIVEALHAVTIARGSEQLKTIAEAAFRAAGFEVVE